MFLKKLKKFYLRGLQSDMIVIELSEKESERMTKKKLNSRIIRKVILSLVTLLIIVYVVYVFGRAGFTQIKSVGAVQTTVYDSIDVNAYIVRSERYVEYKDGGIISYTVSDGDKVSKNENIANVFDNAGLSGKKQELDELEKKLASLEQLEKNIGTFTQTPDEIDKSVSDLLCRSNIDVAQGNLSLADKNIQDILYAINERQLITEKASSYEEKIKEIKERMEEIKNSDKSVQKNKSVNASVSGYFSSHTDGYEKSFDVSKLSELMPGDLDEKNIKTSDIPKNTIGKIIDKVYWYLVFQVSQQDALRIKNAPYLKVNIPVVSNKNIQVELACMNQPDKMSDALVVMKGTYMDERMANVRHENISLILDDFTGIYVPKSAVHEKMLEYTSYEKNNKAVTVEKNTTGVYVRRGSEISFRQIKQIYSGEDFVICDVSIKDEDVADDVKILQIYDQIVTEGANLYDGKIIQRSS